MKAPVEFDDLDELPPGWAWKPLQDLSDDPSQDIVDGPFGSNLKASEYVDEGAPIARLQNISRNQFLDKSIRCVTHEKAQELARHGFSVGDILLTKLGDPLGKACIVPAAIGSGVIVADLVRIRPSAGLVDTRYLTYAINSPAVIRNLERHTKGTTRPRVNLNVVRQLPIPVAPREHQGEVVAEIEKQFSRLDEVVANLQRVKANLRRYRSSVLVDAFTHKSKRWGWAPYDKVGEVTTGFTPPTDEASNFGGDLPFFKPTDLDAGDNVRTAREYLSERGLSKGRRLRAGSVLVTCIGATIGKTGLAVVDCATNQQINAVSPHEGIADSRFVYWWTVSPSGQRQILENASATTLPIINKSKFSALLVPLPPLAEQRSIVAEVDRRLSIVRGVQAEVDTNLKRTQALRQAVLARAFSGGLNGLD